jgi:hypothetical protein
MSSLTAAGKLRKSRFEDPIQCSGFSAVARTRRFSGDQQSFIRMKRLADQFLRDIGAVVVSRIDEVDANLGEPAERGKCRIAVGRRIPRCRGR